VVVKPAFAAWLLQVVCVKFGKFGHGVRSSHPLGAADKSINSQAVLIAIGATPPEGTVPLSHCKLELRGSSPLARARERSYVTVQLARERREKTLRSIAVIGIAVALSMVGLGASEPAVAKVRKGCRTQQQHQVNQTAECEDIIIENLDRGVSSTGHFYRNNSRKAKKHPRGTR
jgi:hypothetical protein